AELSAADAVLVSHLHRDHLDLPSLRQLPSTTPLIVPRGAAGVASKAGADRISEVALGQTISVGAVTVPAVPALHDGRRTPWGKPADALGDVIAGGGRRRDLARGA